MIVGITGTQKGATDKQVRALFDLLVELDPDAMEHGDCIGVDKEAHEIGEFLGLKLVGRPPIVSTKRAFCKFDIEHPPEAYLKRNHKIVKDCDILIALPSGPEVLRSGTWATIRYADKVRKPKKIIWPDGSIT